MGHLLRHLQAGAAARLVRSATSGSTYYYTLDTYDFDTLMARAAARRCPPACAGTLIRGPIDFRHVSTGADTLEPDLQAHEEPGVVVRPRAPADRDDGRQRPLRPQVARPRGSRTRARSTRTRTKSTSSPTRASASRALACQRQSKHSPQPEGRSATTTASSSSCTKNLANNWSLPHELHVEPPLRELLGPVAVGRERPHRPERRPRVRLPDHEFDQNGEAEFGPLGTDRPHQFKAQAFIYQLPFGTCDRRSTQSSSSGIPVTREIAVCRRTTSRCSTRDV